jgi:hypothetical protein
MPGPSPDKPDAPSEPERQPGPPERAPDGVPASGFPETPGEDPGDRSRDPSPHHALNTPVGEPDPTEWPDPYDRREDPLDPPDPDGMPFGEQPHPHTGATSTSQPHPSQDPEAPDWEGPKRDKLDD